MEGGSYLHFGIVNMITIAIMVFGIGLAFKGANTLINSKSAS